MIIQVLGPGCRGCRETERVIREAVREAGIDAQVEKVADLQAIAQCGVFTTPAVIVDGAVSCVGKVPSRQEVLSWITGSGVGGSGGHREEAGRPVHTGGRHRCCSGNGACGESSG